MSEKLRSALYLQVEEEKHRIDRELATYKDALVKASDPKGLSLVIIVEGVDEYESQPMRRVLNDLCKTGLVTTDIHYTHRNAQLIARATPQGMQIAHQLEEEKRQ